MMTQVHEEFRGLPAGNTRFLTCFCVGAVALILLWPALMNGFPFIYYDTGTYLKAALSRTIPWDRPVFYSIFALLLHWKYSLWPIVVAQALVVSALIQLTANLIFGIKSTLGTILTGLVLAAASSLPWFVGQIMPDIFTSVLILSILLITIAWHRMKSIERWFALALIPVSVSFHYASCLIALSMIPALALMYLTGWRPGPYAYQRMLLIGAAIVIGVAGIIGSNLISKKRKITLSPSSYTFLFAKLLEDDRALAVLEEACPGGSVLCSQLSRLQAQSPASRADYFLWYGPLADLGWWKEVEPDAAKLVKRILSRYWRVYIVHAVIGSYHQFLSIKIGDQLGRIEEDSVPLSELFGADVSAKYRSSMQARGLLRLDLVNGIISFVAIISGIVLIFSLVAPPSGGQDIRYAAALLIVFLIGNAVVIGSLSPLHDRYQSRVVWLVPLFGVLALIRFLSKPLGQVRACGEAAADH